MGNQKIMDRLIKAGAKGDPLLYAAGCGDVPALEKAQADKSIDDNNLKKIFQFSIAANRPATAQWSWALLSSRLDATAKEKLLAGALYDAANWNRLEMIHYLESLGLNVKKNGDKALGAAVVNDYVPVAAHLMDKGILPGGSSETQGLLRIAAGDNTVEMVKTLLDHGANINELDDEGETPLSWAASSLKTDNCLLLIERGADISIKDKRGQTSLWWAAFAGNSPETVDLLLKRGADPRGTNKAGFPILSSILGFVPPRKGEQGFPGKIYTDEEVLKFKDNLIRTVRALVKAGADPDAVGGFYGTPLIEAIQGGHPEIAETLIGLGADIKKTDSLGNTPLSFVFGSNWGLGVDVNLVRLLLDRGANPNGSHIQPHTTPPPSPVPIIEQALVLSSWQSHLPDLRQNTTEALKLFLQHGAKFPVTGDGRGSDWLAAAAQNNLPRLKELHTAGIDLDTASSGGWTALTISMALGNTAIKDWLIREGANLALKKNSFTPLFFATQMGDISLVKKFLKAGAKPDYNVMSTASSLGNLELFKLLKEGGGDASNVYVDTLVREGYSGILKIALENGADPKGMNSSEKRNTVYWAVFYNQPECLKLLLQYGVQADQKSIYDETPLSYAKEFRPELVPILEEAIRKNGTASASKPNG